MSDLKPQNQLGKIDFSNPKMQPMVRMLQSNIQRDTLKWQPGAGIHLHREEFSAGGKASFHCLVLEPEESKGACLFCHGGGMIFPLQVSSLKVAEYLAKAAKISMWVPDYSLPPAAPFPYPVEECLHVWQRMCRPAETCILYGESVGGALAASLTMVLRDQKEKQPDRLMLIDPVTDCETEKYPSAGLDAQAAGQRWFFTAMNQGCMIPSGSTSPLLMRFTNRICGLKSARRSAASPRPTKRSGPWY